MIAIAGGLFARRALFLTRLVRSGKPVNRVSDLPIRVRNETTIVLGQRKLLQRLGPGLVHAFIFWGFVVLFPTIFMAIVAIVDREPSLPSGSPLGWLESQGWYALLVDLFAVLVLMGVAAAFWIRKVQRPARFEGSHLGEADLILALIAGIVTTLLLWHATQIALGLNPWPADWSPVSDALSGLFGDDTTTEVLERVFVWAHVLIILGFLTYLPHSKHLHIATAAINVFFGQTRARGRLEPLDFESEDEAALRFGAGTVADLTWKQMLDSMSCTECGRCQDVCPAVRDRQGALAEAPDHGHPRSPVRRGTGGARRRRPLPARPERGHGRGRVGLRDLRRVRARVPGLDRARRPHRRPPPQPRHGRVAAPGRDRDDAA